MANPGYVVPVGTQTKEGFHAIRRTTEGLLYYTKVNKDSGESLDFEGGSPTDPRNNRQISTLSEYVDELDSVQREFLEERLPDNLQVLLEPQKLDPDEFENIKGSLKTYLQGGRLPGFNGKALLPQAASLCRTGLG